MSQYASEIAIQDIDGDGKNDVVGLAGNSTMDLRVHDAQGRTLLQKKISMGTSFIDCKTWVPGIYSVTVYDGTQMVTTKRFMKQ